MHSYLHNIKTFNNATRHLTRVERALYRDAIELYYDTEQPLPAVDFDRLARRLMANTEEEVAALEYILGEFFERTGDVYTHHYCDEVIEAYHNSTTAKSIAGKASAAARKKKAEERRAARKGQKEQKATAVEQPLNTPSAAVANHEPLTINHEPLKESAPDGAVSAPVPYSAIVDLYHKTLPSLAAVKVVTDKRKAAIRQRHASLMDKSLANWRSYFESVLRSDFLMGRIDGKTWQADFDFLISERAVTGVVEGKYHAKTGLQSNGGSHPPRAPTPAERVAAKRAAAGSPDVGAMVPDVGNVRPYLVTGPGR